MRKGKIALLITSLVSAPVFSAGTISDENLSHLLDVVPSGVYRGDFGNKHTVGNSIHTGLDIWPRSYVSSNYSYFYTINSNNEYTLDDGDSDDNNNSTVTLDGINTIDVTAAYDGYIVGHKTYRTAEALRNSKYGDFYLIKHPQAGKNAEDLYTLYLHLAHPSLVGDQRSNPEIGDYISKGDLLGIMYKGGSTANDLIHLHYSIQTFSDIAESPHFWNVYPTKDTALGDTKVTIEGVEMTKTEYYDSVIMDPETFIFPESIEYESTSTFSLARTLRGIDYDTELNNTSQCSMLLSKASKLLPDYKHLKSFESNFSSYYSNSNNIEGEQEASCLFKNIEKNTIVRYNVSDGDVFVYDREIDMGYKHISSDQFTDDNDTAKEVFDFWNTKLPNNSGVNSYAVNLLNSSLSTYTSGNLSSCITEWNSQQSEANASITPNSEVQIYLSNNKCVVFDRFNSSYLYYNDELGQFTFSNNFLDYKKIRKEASIYGWLNNADPCTKDYCLSTSVEMNKPVVFWLKHNGENGISLFHEVYTGDKQVLFTFEKSINDRQKYVYISHDDAFAVVYDVETELPNIVMNGTDNFKSLKDFKYSFDENNDILSNLLSFNKKSFPSADSFRVNFQGVKFTRWGSIECSPSFISQENKDLCGNGEIDTDEECASIWRAAFYHSDSFNGYKSKSLGYSHCEFINNTLNKKIVYYAPGFSVDVKTIEVDLVNELNNSFPDGTTFETCEAPFLFLMKFRSMMGFFPTGSNMNECAIFAVPDIGENVLGFSYDLENSKWYKFGYGLLYSISN